MNLYSSLARPIPFLLEFASLTARSELTLSKNSPQEFLGVPQPPAQGSPADERGWP